MNASRSAVFVAALLAVVPLYRAQTIHADVFDITLDWGRKASTRIEHRVVTLEAGDRSEWKAIALALRDDGHLQVTERSGYGVTTRIAKPAGLLFVVGDHPEGIRYRGQSSGTVRFTGAVVGADLSRYAVSPDDESMLRAAVRLAIEEVTEAAGAARFLLYFGRVTGFNGMDGALDAIDDAVREADEQFAEVNHAGGPRRRRHYQPISTDHRVMAAQCALLAGDPSLYRQRPSDWFASNTVAPFDSYFIYAKDHPAEARAEAILYYLDHHRSVTRREELLADLRSPDFGLDAAMSDPIVLRIEKEIRGRRPVELLAIGASLMIGLFVSMLAVRKLSRRFATT